MKHGTANKLRCLVLVTLGALLVRAPDSRAELLVGGQIGAGHLQLGELEDFWNEFSIGHDADDLALHWELSATWRFAERHAVRLSVERITMSIMLHDPAYFDPPFSMGFLLSEKNFETVPVSISYEFVLHQSTRGASTLAGAGAGVYISEIEGNEVFYHEDPLLSSVYHGSRKGEGYGFHAYVRQSAPILDHLSLTGMLRGRWADGMAFDDSERDYAVDFVDFDVAVGVEWNM